jgi:hypothetical protein
MLAWYFSLEVYGAKMGSFFHSLHDPHAVQRNARTNTALYIQPQL